MKYHAGNRRSLWVLLCVLLASSVSAPSCAVDQQAVNGNANNQVEKNVSDGGHIIQIDSYDLVDEHLQVDLTKIYRKLELAPMTPTADKDEFQFRIWTNLGGLGNPSVFAARLSGTGRNAVFIKIDKTGDSMKSTRQNLSRPKSDWTELPFQVRSRLTTPKGLVRDPQFSLARDEPVILLEVFDKEEYRRIFYGQNTTFEDGLRLIEFCKWISSEFDIEMLCGGQDRS